MASADAPLHSTMASSRPRLLSSPNALLPGLPHSVVLDCILPLIPWHTRPLLKTLSKAWRDVLLDPSLYSSLTRSLAPLQGLILVHQLSDDAATELSNRFPTKRRFPRPHALSIFDERARLWTQLPPIPDLQPLRILHDCGIACVDGKLVVMGGWDPRTNAVSDEVYLLDLGSGFWQWEKRCSMHTAKAFFFSKSVAGKVYVVAGTSSAAGRDEEPFPEVYDVQTDTWDLLPRINISRSFHFNGLSAAGNHVLAYGFRHFSSGEGGELTRFWRVYDSVTRNWSDWDCDLSNCSRVLDGDHDLRDGIVHKFDAMRNKWRALAGKLSVQTCRWEGGKKVLSDSTCAHSFLVVTECSKPHVYATIWDGEDRCLRIWRGDLNYSYYNVSWQQIELPGSLSMCSEMCYLCTSSNQSQM